MADSEIMEYVKTQLKAGYTEEQIRKALLDADYTIEEVNEAITSQSKPPAAPKPPKPEKRVGGKVGFILSLIGGVLILVTIIFMFMGYPILDDTLSQIPLLGVSSLGIIGNDLVVLNIILAAGIILGSVLSHKKKEMIKTTGVVVILLSIISLLNGGGFFLAIISVIGGLLLLKEK